MRIETVSYSVDWSKLYKGQSFFIPCIDSNAARYTLRKVARRLKMKFIMKVVIQDGVKGLRVWRD